jgi:cytochrome c553
MMKQVIVMTAALAIPAGFAFAQGDAGAGKEIFERDCGSCHYEDDFSGKSAQDILGLVKEQAAPDAGHMFDMSTLSEKDMADIAAFFASKGD